MFSNSNQQYNQQAEVFSACGGVFEKPELSLYINQQDKPVIGRHSQLI